MYPPGVPFRDSPGVFAGGVEGGWGAGVEFAVLVWPEVLETVPFVGPFVVAEGPFPLRPHT